MTPGTPDEPYPLFKRETASLAELQILAPQRCGKPMGVMSGPPSPRGVKVQSAAPFDVWGIGKTPREGRWKMTARTIPRAGPRIWLPSRQLLGTERAKQWQVMQQQLRELEWQRLRLLRLRFLTRQTSKAGELKRQG